MRPGTIVTHIACDTPIFFVERGLLHGDVVAAVAWKPLRPDWPQPHSGEPTICPNCKQGFLPADTDLRRKHVDDIEPWGYGI